MTETEWPDDWPLRAIERIECAEEEAFNFSRMMVAEEKRAQKAEREVAELREACQAALDEFAIGNFNAARRQRVVEFIRRVMDSECHAQGGV